MASKVFFSDFRTPTGFSLLKKLRKMLIAAGIDTIPCEGKFVAVKLHFGEPGNMAYLRANYVEVIVQELKKLGGYVFLTDANTLYSGGRSNAVNHLESAMKNGFNPIAVSAPVIIADGLNGTDTVEMEVKGGEYCHTAIIGSAIAKADVIISVTHFKGHEMTGFGGTLKNLGMGAASRIGKMMLHADSKPVVNVENCIGCRMCEKSCAHAAIKVGTDRKAAIDYTRCVGCGQCIATCQKGGVISPNDTSSHDLNCKIAEYTKAILDGKPAFHISFIMDVSPECDCWPSNDAAIVPNVGMAASFDPIALDMACAELVMQAPALPNTMYTDKHYAAQTERCSHPHNCQGDNDKFYYTHPDTDWKSGLVHGEKIGLGTMDYELVRI
ncbi:MAG: DUF362 domain-containing protein [Alistipes sp.]|nr:DUF362 domain-containing protein [Candidatus Minthomonas equi]